MHDARVVRDVRRGGGEICDLGERDGPAHRVELLLQHQVLGERDQIDRAARFVDRAHRAEQRLVRRVVEVVGADLGEHFVEGARIE